MFERFKGKAFRYMHCVRYSDDPEKRTFEWAFGHFLNECGEIMELIIMIFFQKKNDAPNTSK